jgi:hypothetical protein
MKVMGFSNNKTNKRHIACMIDNKDVAIVNQFKYLGSVVTCDSNINVKINHRITI